MLQRWLAVLVEQHGASATVQTYLANVKTFFRYLTDEGILPKNPCASLQIPFFRQGRRETFLPAGEVAKLFALARLEPCGDLEWVLAMGFECGMRRGEIASARAEWIDLRTGCLRIPEEDGRFTRKGREGGRREAIIPLSRVVLEIIERRGIPTPFLIRPEKEWGTWIYRTDFRKLIMNFFTAQGHPELTIHDMRRSFASNKVSAGVSIEKVANGLAIDVQTAWKRYSRFVPGDSEINVGSAGTVRAEVPTSARTVLADSPTPVPERTAAETMAARLATLNDLRAAGVVTDEEFAARRAGILGEI
jgi:integrase